MRRVEIKQIIRNVGSSWIALGVNVIVGFFLSPFILHRLGDRAFGIWVLIFAVTGYYGLFDLGIRSSIVRYVSKARATGDTHYASQILSTSLFTYCCIGAISLLLTGALAIYLQALFRIPPEFESTARLLLVIVGVSVAAGFPLGVSGGILEGLQEFSVLNWTSILSTLARAVLIVIVLQRGYGLVALALITVSLPVVTAILRWIIALRMFPAPISMKYVDRAIFREIAHYSGTTMVMIVATRLRFKSDSVIIGSFLGSAAITYFNIGSRIVDYAGEVVESLAQIFVPMSSHSDALGEMDRLRKIFVAGNRFCALIIFPICALLIILGKAIITVWVGARYVTTSYPILIVLLLPTTLMLAQAASGRVLLGMSKHRIWAFVILTEGIVNIILSIALVRPYGIMGDALGTAIPLAVTMIFFLPQHLCRQLKIKMWTYLREAYLLPLALCVPVTITLLLMKRWFVPRNYGGLVVHLAVAGTVYGLCLAWAFASKRAMRMGTLHIPEPASAVALDSATAVETFSHDA